MNMLTMVLSKLAAFGDSCSLSNGSFFGIKPWYNYLEGQEDSFGQCVPKVFNRTAEGIEGIDIVLIILAVVDSLLKIAVLVAFAFVLYGGFQYIVSQGEPEKTNNAKNTILNSLVGLVIALSAVAIVSFIGSSLT